MSVIKNIPEKPRSDMATIKFKRTVTSGVSEELHEYNWVIKNWELVQVDENLVKDQQFEIITGQHSSLLGKFIVGLEVSAADANGNRFVGVYCKLKELTGSKTEIPLQFSVNIENAKEGGYFWQPAAICKSMKVQDTCNHANAMEFNKHANQEADKYLVNGDLTFSVTLRVMNPLSVPQSFTSSMDSFNRKSSELLRIDFASLLSDEEAKTGSDFKIISSDKLEFPCHRAILSARSRKLAEMLKSDFAGKDSMTLEHLSGKSMEVLLHYLYTGRLQECWNDTDVIIEFIEAAGTYELKEVLEMVDGMLGSSEESTSITSFMLLELATKLNLVQAKKELMRRIVNFTIKAESSTELLKLVEK